MLFRLSFTRNVRIRHSLPDYESVSEMQLQCGNSKYNGELPADDSPSLTVHHTSTVGKSPTFNAFSMNNIVTQGKINVKGYPEFLSNIDQIQGHLEHV